ncbi:hypothetical protein H8R94_01670 [Roseburia sp. NSJ-9]|uniref:Conjugal transfer protein TrbL n=1 Tax=Roseburia lenta TaxID=2763061 RepID=A0ABR7GD19_9FIRM|nr:hypothetical protein [Roseburia lenta]MBC5685334.1 hypothetical protein [Roseburia lenta]
MDQILGNSIDIAWSGGSATWNILMTVIQSIITMTPQEIFPDAWQVTTEIILPWFIGAGAACINMIFMIGFMKQTTNFRENLTLEVFVEGGIRIIIANTLLIYSQTIMEDFINLATMATKFVMGTEPLKIVNPTLDVGTVLFYFVLGIIYFIASAVCAGNNLLTVLKRVAYILFCIIAVPVAAVTFVGDREMANTGRAAIKTFFTYCFQIVVIAFWLRIGTLMASGISGLIISQTNDSGLFDGFYQALNNMICMIFMTSLIKNSDELLRKAFDLR